MTEAPSERTRVKRMNKRAAYDAATVNAILDATPICHVGYIFKGAPFVTPTLQWREGDHVYWHGSSASRMLEAAEDMEVCLTVTLIDGFVMARSAYNHSCNYRSVMVFGKAFRVTDRARKIEHLKRFTDRLFPGRWDTLRPATEQEIKATTVLGLTLDESSAKVRSGPPGDEPEDYAWPAWGGVIPVSMVAGTPVPDGKSPAGVALPAHVSGFRIG